MRWDVPILNRELQEDDRVTQATTYRWEDDYADLHVDDSTYADFDWDDVPAEVVNRHDTLLTLDADALAATALGEGEDAVHRWAIARRWLELGETARFVDVARSVLATEGQGASRWLSYPDIKLELGRVLAATDLDGAHKLFDEYAAADGASLSEAARYRGYAEIAHGDRAKGIALLEEAVREHAAREPEIAGNFAEPLLDAQDTEAAHAVLAAGIEAARAQDDASLVHELEDLVRLTS